MIKLILKINYSNCKGIKEFNWFQVKWFPFIQILSKFFSLVKIFHIWISSKSFSFQYFFKFPLLKSSIICIMSWPFGFIFNSSFFGWSFLTVNFWEHLPTIIWHIEVPFLQISQVGQTLSVDFILTLWGIIPVSFCVIIF